MKEATLCFLIKEGKKKDVLLAMKKRGFGVGKWNGVGGKVDERDSSIEDAVLRETEEEIGVKLKDMEKVAVLSFNFPYKEEWNQNVHVFLARDWEGEPKESEEMAPKWFKESELPFDEMWEDDSYWVSRALKGEKLKAEFIFKEGEKIDKYNINKVKEV